MGGMGFIHSAECEIMRNSMLVNLNMIEASAALGVPRYFFSSSVCIYRDMKAGEPELLEEDAYPAQPDNEYGWEKLYSERALLAAARRHGFTARIARFQNCYGPEGTWDGGREKAPAALCRKVAEAKDGGRIEVWGDGSAIRSYTYVDDMVDGIRRLMDSDLEGPANIGSPEYVSVKELVDTVMDVARKRVHVEWVSGPVGVQSRNFSNARIYSTGWQPRFSLRDGIARIYPWIERQVETARVKS
jgi:GDP-D-mannose 3', 5'-epimerase